MALDLEAFRAAISKRGFRVIDPLLHGCPACKAPKSVEKWGLVGKTGGRDIDICRDCGKVSSWRKRPTADREEDTTFDPVAFMK